MQSYGIIIEQGGGDYSAYVPDLPGCVVTGDTLEEVHRLMLEAVRFHLEGMSKDGLAVPDPDKVSIYVIGLKVYDEHCELNREYA
jgi:predicted RNase H-like HicB family nuclease